MAPPKSKTKAKPRLKAKAKAKPKAKPALKAKPASKAASKATSRATSQAMRSSKSRPANAPALAPHLVCAGADKAIDFYKKAFGAIEMMRLAGRDGKLIHAALQVNGAPVMLVDEFPMMGNASPHSLKGTPVTIHMTVEDVDSFTQRALKAGAKVIMPVDDMFWGDRYGIIEDPFGHRWSIATHLRDMTADEIKKAMLSAMPG
jgi:PhnB protein